MSEQLLRIILVKAAATAALNAIVDAIISTTDGNNFCVNLYTIGNGGSVTYNACCWAMEPEQEEAFLVAAASYINSGDVVVYDGSQTNFPTVLAQNNLKIKDPIK